MPPRAEEPGVQCHSMFDAEPNGCTNERANTKPDSYSYCSAYAVTHNQPYAHANCEPYAHANAKAHTEPNAIANTASVRQWRARLSRAWQGGNMLQGGKLVQM